MGRKTKLTPEVQQEIVNALRDGATYEIAALKGGISPSTLYNWLNRGEKDRSGPFSEFLAAVTRARAEAVMRNVQVVQVAAVGYPEKETITVTRKRRDPETGEMIVETEVRVTERMVRDWRAAAWWLEHHKQARDEFSPKTDLHVDAEQPAVLVMPTPISAEDWFQMARAQQQFLEEMMGRAFAAATGEEYAALPAGDEG